MPCWLQTLASGVMQPAKAMTVFFISSLESKKNIGKKASEYLINDDDDSIWVYWGEFK